MISHKKLFASALFLAAISGGFACVQSAAQAPAAPVVASKTGDLRVYFIGNSVTDTIRYDALQKLAESRGHKHIWGRHMIPGAPLEWIWSHPKDGISQGEFGLYPKALPDFAWDAISLQPFDRKKEGDLEHIQKFVDLALQNPRNAQTQFFIYARWPRMSKNGKGVTYDKNNFGKDGDDPNKITDYSSIDDWKMLWDRKYTGGWDSSEESADYFQTLALAARKAHPELKKPIAMVPVGHVMAALHKKMAAGEVPGFKNIWDVYADGIHLNQVGSYVVGCTYYATLYRESPVGLTGAPYGLQNEKLAKIIQQTAWEVVQSEPLAGVAVEK